MSTSISRDQASCLSSWPYSIFGETIPFFHLSFGKAFGERSPGSPKVPPAGFGYPLGGFAPFLLGNFFNSQRSWASLFRAFLLLSDRLILSNQPFRSCAFVQNLPALYRRYSGLLPVRKPCLPFCAPES